MPKKLRTLDLFTGIGGTHLALASITKPVAYCEIDERCVDIIKRRLPRAPIFPDVTKLTAKELLATLPKDAKPQLITASFPCQDVSAAGRGDGIGRGTRSSLVFDVFRLVDEIGSSVELIFLENSPMIRTRGLDKIVKACRKRGFDRIVWTLSSARDVGAHHLRLRWFLMAARSRHGLINIPITHGWDSFRFQDEAVPRLKLKEAPKEVSKERKSVSALGNAVVPASLAHAWDCLANELNAQATSITKQVVPSRMKQSRVDLMFATHSNISWATPVYNPCHYYPKTKFEGRTVRTLATQVFHEQGTQKAFKFKDVRTARRTLCLNPEWVEALMGFPRGWTDVNKNLSMAKHFAS